VTRRNDRTNTTGDRFVANRDVWQITDLYDDGAVIAARVDPDSDQVLPDRQVRLDGDYVATLSSSTTPPPSTPPKAAPAPYPTPSSQSGPAATPLYVAVTRGVEANRAYVV
jgi:hypothetical protein